MVHVYSGLLLSLKENEIVSFIATWEDLETLILSEESQTEKEKYCTTNILYKGI